VSYSEELETSQGSTHENIPVEQTPQVVEPEVILTEETTVETLVPEQVPEEPAIIVPEKIIKEAFFEKTEPKKLIEHVLTKKIILDKHATHSCESSLFSIDLEEGATQINLLIHRDERSGFGTLDIGNLPKGIDIKIYATGEYSKQVQENEASIKLSITKQSGAQKGSFNVPIIYTMKDSLGTSSSICQINIINND